METGQSITHLALTYFLVTNPIGNSPLILTLLKNFNFDKQRQIMLREGIFTFLVMLVFQFLGEYFLTMLSIEPPALTLCGGIILFLLAMGMLFPSHHENESKLIQQEPYLVPIATPLLAGPGLLSVIMLTAANEDSTFKVSAAITVACVGVISVLYAAPYVQKLIGKVGLQVLEQIMGMILTLMAVEMILMGAGNFVKTL